MDLLFLQVLHCVTSRVHRCAILLKCPFVTAHFASISGNRPFTRTTSQYYTLVGWGYGMRCWFLRQDRWRPHLSSPFATLRPKLWCCNWSVPIDEWVNQRLCPFSDWRQHKHGHFDCLPGEATVNVFSSVNQMLWTLLSVGNLARSCWHLCRGPILKSS